MVPLIYTIAIDKPSGFIYRNLAKLMVSSLMRSGYNGKIVIFHNHHTPLYSIPRLQVIEVHIATPDSDNENFFSWYHNVWSLKHQLGLRVCREYSEWDRLAFIDADCVITGDMSSLVSEASADLLLFPEKGQLVENQQFNSFFTSKELDSNRHREGYNSGIFSVNRKSAEKFFLRWQEVESQFATEASSCRDQAALNKLLIIDHDFTVKEDKDLIYMPYHTDMLNKRTKNSNITHWVGLMDEDKLRASFGLFMEVYMYDPYVTMFNLLEQ